MLVKFHMNLKMYRYSLSEITFSTNCIFKNTIHAIDLANFCIAYMFPINLRNLYIHFQTDSIFELNIIMTVVSQYSCNTKFHNVLCNA